MKKEVELVMEAVGVGGRGEGFGGSGRTGCNDEFCLEGLRSLGCPKHSLCQPLLVSLVAVFECKSRRLGSPQLGLHKQQM